MKSILKNIRAVSLAVNVPGPAAAARLAAMGATVTKVEPPNGDPLANYSAGWYKALAANQEVVTLNLKQPEGAGRLQAMLARADLLLTAQRPAALGRLSLDWPRLHGQFPRLCQVAIVGHPHPNQNLAGHDLTYAASAGLMSPPELPLTLLADLSGAEMAVSAALALLFNREKTGEGGYAEVALSEAAEGFARPLKYGLTKPGGILGGGLPGYACYAARDGFVAVAALEPHFLERLLHELNLEKPGREEFEQIFATKTAAEWETWANDRDLPICKIRERHHAQ